MPTKARLTCLTVRRVHARGGQPVAVISRAERQLSAAADCVASRLPRPARPRPSLPLPGGITVPRPSRGRHRFLAVLATDGEYLGNARALAQQQNAESERLRAAQAERVVA